MPNSTRRPSPRCLCVPKLKTFFLLVEEGWKGTSNKLQYACAWEAPITDFWAAESMQTTWNVSEEVTSHDFPVAYTWFILTTGDSSWSRSESSFSDLGCSSCRILSNIRKSLVSDSSSQSSFVSQSSCWHRSARMWWTAIGFVAAFFA